MFGAMPKKDVFALLDHFYSEGGNFIDTANNYQNEQSELWIGEWLASKAKDPSYPNFRDQVFLLHPSLASPEVNPLQMVIATKYTTCFVSYKQSDHPDALLSNYLGNNTKSLRLSVEASLKKLQTDYIDILYVHWWDFTTSIPELMLSLNALVDQGKILYLGISDTPAWIVSKANE